MSEYAQLGQLTCSQNGFKFNGKKKEIKENMEFVYEDRDENCLKEAGINNCNQDNCNPSPPLRKKYEECVCRKEEPGDIDGCVERKLESLFPFQF